MMNTYIDISDKFEDPLIIETIRELDRATKKLSMPFFIVGATARDLVLQYGFNLNPGRATADIDFGVRVSSLDVCLSSDPELVVKVASPIGLVILKLLAWGDRKPETRDAIDLGYLVRDYLNLGNTERLFDEHPDLVDEDFDYQVAGAHLLGRDLSQACDKKTRDLLIQILEPELDRNGSLPLVVQSAGSSPEIDRTYLFWSAIYTELIKL